MSRYENPPVRNQRTVTVGVILFVILALVGFLVWEHKDTPLVAKFLGTKPPHSTSTAQFVSKATFVCNENKTITASFFVPPGSTSPETPGSASLVLSDGRSMTLLQTMSGSGARYASADDLLVFWNKGNTSFIQEGSAQTETFSHCTTASNLLGVENWSIFASSTMQLSLRYPKDFSLRRSYSYALRDPGAVPISGIKFMIPAALYQGTNLSGFDTGVSVEQLPEATSTCSALVFLPNNGVEEKSLTDKGVEYRVATFTGAAAGNRYDETVFVIKNAPLCTAVRYFIHSTNIGNYTQGTIKEFDKTALLAQFDKIRESLVFEH